MQIIHVASIIDNHALMVMGENEYRRVVTEGAMRALADRLMTAPEMSREEMYMPMEDRKQVRWSIAIAKPDEYWVHRRDRAVLSPVYQPLPGASHAEGIRAAAFDDAREYILKVAIANPPVEHLLRRIAGHVGDMT